MTLKQTWINYLFAFFILFEMGIWLTIQCPLSHGGNILRFTSVALAFFFSLLSFAKWDGMRAKKTYLLQCGLLTTVCADVCLVLLTPMERLGGMVFFCFTQLFYLLYLFSQQTDAREKKIHLIVRLSLTCVLPLLALCVLGDGTDLLSILSVIYYANLIVNICFSARIKRGTLLLLIGLISFALCDLFVGLGTLCELYLDVEKTSFIYRITHTSMDVIWFFYIPSQTLISLYTVKESLGAKE